VNLESLPLNETVNQWFSIQGMDDSLHNTTMCEVNMSFCRTNTVNKVTFLAVLEI